MRSPRVGTRFCQSPAGEWLGLLPAAGGWSGGSAPRAQWGPAQRAAAQPWTARVLGVIEGWAR